MAKYLRNATSTVVEAYRTPKLDRPLKSDWAAWRSDVSLVDFTIDGDGKNLLINLSDGGTLVRPGDWIVKNTDGTFTRITPQSFVKLFKPAWIPEVSPDDG